MFQPPRRDFLVSDSVSFGSITFSFDATDQISSINLFLYFEAVYPAGSVFFPDWKTNIYDVARLMRDQSIPFEDTSPERDWSELRTDSGVVIGMSLKHDEYGRVLCCISDRHSPHANLA